MKQHFWFAAWLALCLPAQAENPLCTKVAAADFLPRWGINPVVPALIAGKVMPMDFSTSNQQSYIYQRWQDEAGIASLPVPKGSVRTEEAVLTHYIRADDFALGEARFAGSRFLVLPNPPDDKAAPGALGLDFMYRYNVDFDFAARKVTLFTAETCTPDPAWSGPGASALGFKFDREARPIVKIKLDGEELLARLDTGSTQTVMGLETARDLFHINEMALVRSGDHYEYAFKTLQLGGITLAGGTLYLVPEAQSGLFHEGSPIKWVKLHVGTDQLQRLHLYMAYRQSSFYLLPAR